MFVEKRKLQRKMDLRAVNGRHLDIDAMKWKFCKVAVATAMVLCLVADAREVQYR